MSLVVSTTPQKFPDELRQRMKTMPSAVRKGLLSAARRGRTLLVRRTPKDRGQARAAWRVEKGKIALVNDAPHVGILEHGARAHNVSREGRIALAGWAMRKFGVQLDEAMKIARAIAFRMRSKPTPGLYFVRNSMDELFKFTTDEVTKALEKHSRQRNPDK